MGSVDYCSGAQGQTPPDEHVKVQHVAVYFALCFIIIILTSQASSQKVDCDNP